MYKEFESYQLNEIGMVKVREARQAFSALLDRLNEIGVPTGREFALVRTKLEEACFFTNKAIASNTDHQQS